MRRARYRAAAAAVLAGCLGATVGACGKPAGDADGAEKEAPASRPTGESAALPEGGKAVAAADGSTPDADADGPPVRKDGTIFAESELMGTRISINVFVGVGEGGRAKEAGDAMQAALEAMADIEDVMSEWRPHSELSRLSDAAGGEPMKVSAGLLEILARSRAIAEATGGAFDPTFHGVGQLWSFRPGAEPPTREAVAEKLPLVGWDRIELDQEKGTVRLRDAGMRLGLGAIAKGYAVDVASALLAERGFANHVVEAGGDTYARGAKAGKPWAVGIQSPGRPGVVGVLPMRDRAVVTSGDYQRFLEHDGKRYAHILDPRTGWPVEADISAQSVTLVADNATDADAYATAVAVMGPKRGMAFVEGREDLEAVILERDGTLVVSTGLRDVLKRPPPVERRP